MKSRKWLAAVSAVMALGIFLGASVPAMAQEPQPVPTTIVDFMKLHPMSPKAEAAIVHEVPPVEFVIIDGAKYESEDITLFNGKRLGFAFDKDGQIYAFTTAEGLKLFLDYEHESIKEPGGNFGIQAVQSTLHQHIWFTGTMIPLEVNQGNPNLGSMNNQISSLKNNYGYETYLFDYTDYGGDYAVFDRTFDPILFFYNDLHAYSWGDKAESAICFPW